MFNVLKQNVEAILAYKKYSHITKRYSRNRILLVSKKNNIGLEIIWDKKDPEWFNWSEVMIDRSKTSVAWNSGNDPIGKKIIRELIQEFLMNFW